MSKLRLRRPSPALVISCLALFVALSGTSYAVINLPRNSVGPKQLKKNAVTSPKVKDNALTGVDVNEATLAQVPSAGNAGSANTAGNADLLDGSDSLAFVRNGAAAGGELGGTYPNPTIRNGVVDSGNVADNSLTGSDIDEATLGQVPDAAQLGGAAAATYAFRCGANTLSNVYQVNAASTGFPTTYTGDSTWVVRGAGNCLSAFGYVKRVGTGEYWIANPFNIDRFLVGSVLEADNDHYLVWERVSEGGNDVFRVIIRDADGGTRDTPFVVALFR